MELDPAAPRPEGPARLRAQAADPGDRGAEAPRADGRQALPASDPQPHGGPVPSVRSTGPPHRDGGMNRGTPEEDPPPQQAGRAEGSPTGAGNGKGGIAQHEARGDTAPSSARQTSEGRGRPGDVCALLGIGPGAGAPVRQGDPPPEAQPGGGPARARTVHAQTKPALSGPEGQDAA